LAPALQTRASIWLWIALDTDVGQAESEARLRNRILAHLAIHPHAADTVAGIASWWLEDDEVMVESVEHVVLELVDAGVMERRLSPDGTPIYGLARRR
jgi:hypothetical protein